MGHLKRRDEARYVHAVFGAELPGRRSERWELLGAILERWFPERGSANGVKASELRRAEERLGRPLPSALHEWYERYGARHDVWSQQDRFSMPAEFTVERGVLKFCVENQAVVRWGIRLEDLAADDPPVVVSDPDGGSRWFVESATTSGFAIQLAVMNVKCSTAPVDVARRAAFGVGGAASIVTVG